jgi:transketolase
MYSSSDHHIAASFISNCLEESGPKYLRFDAQVLPELRASIDKTSLIQGFEVLREGDDGVMISTGYMTHTAMQAAEELATSNNFKVIDLFNLTGFDQSALLKAIEGRPVVFSLEEGFSDRGGVDAIIGALLKNANIFVPFKGIGVKPGYSFELGNRHELHEQVGIGRNTVIAYIKETLNSL